MNLKQTLTRLLVALPLFSVLAVEMPAGNLRNTYNFNSDWKLVVGDLQGAEQVDYPDASWESVSLPHAWNENEAFRIRCENLSDTVVWYRKHFRLPAADAGKKVFVEFEGVRQAAQVYVNGLKVGLHENGVMAFGFDISSYLKPNQENVMAVRVDNNWEYREQSTNSTFQWSNRNFNANYGGISKNVFLHVTGSVYQTLPLYSNLKTTGTYIYATNHDVTGKKALVHAESEVMNESPKSTRIALEVLVQDMEGKQVAQFSSQERSVEPQAKVTLKAQAPVSGLHFWSWGYGYLYTVQTLLKVDGVVTDVVSTQTGFRKTEFRNGMVILNDRPIQIKGYAQRSTNEWPAVGQGVPPWMSDYSNGLIVESNGNMVRWMHVTPSKQDAASCDRVGLMQMFPAGDAEGDTKGRRWEQRVELMRDMIIYCRNHPSIILYESGNEAISEEHMAEMKQVRDQYDPNGGRAAGSREMLDSKIAEYGGEMLYINKSARIPLIATEYCRDEALRKYWDEQTPPYHKNGAGPLYRNAPAPDYNRNQDSFTLEEVIRWYDYYSQRPGTGKRVSGGGLNIVFSDTNTHSRGEETYRRSGETDAMRLPKDVFFAHQVMWNGWVDIEKYGAHIVGHWNYKPGTVKDVMVVSSAPRVELILNGKSLGIGERKYEFMHTFKGIAFAPGTLKAVGLSSAGKELCSDVRETTGTPVALKLTQISHPGEVRADGADMVLLQVEAVDAQGRRCPDVFPVAHFELEGPGEWRGGIAQGPDNCILSKDLPVECGVNRVLVRSTRQAGVVTVKVSSEGLKADRIQFETKPFETPGGLTTMMPASQLTSTMRRGETPQGASFKVSRRSLEVVSAKAGANSDKIAQSYDDNELSEWTNDGKLSTAWITYTLAKKSPLSAVCLKLTGWRSRSYPLEILADEKVVWKGETPQSLGYVTLNFKPTSCRRVTIRLTGSGTEKDAFQNMIEVNGTKELDGFKDPKNLNTKGQLRIIEAELYVNP